MSTIYPAASLFQINGVVDTNKTAMQNLTTLANACGCWVTYDIAEGRWSVIINEDSSPVANFDDSNIIGGISISGSGINDMYNQGTIEFPHKDLRDQTDYIDLEVDLENRFPNELDNKLSMSLECINDPIQAQYILNVEMKQSRLDKVISFRTDYTKVGLKAGDIVTVTSDVYGYSSKRFRIITVQEEDDNGITISITAKEHDSSLYSTDGLTRKERKKKTGIVPKSANSALTGSDIASRTNVVYTFLTGLLNLNETPAGETTDYEFLSAPFNTLMNPITNELIVDTYDLGYSYRLPYTGYYRVDYNFNWAAGFNYSPGGSAMLPDAIRKRCAINVKLDGVSQTSLEASVSSIIKGEDSLADMSTSGVFYGYAGQTARFYLNARSDLGPNHPLMVEFNTWAISRVITAGTLIFQGHA